MLAARAGRIAVVADDEGRRRGHEAEGAGRRRRRLRRRRAGLSDAARTSAPRRNAAIDAQLHEVHDQLRHRRAEARHRARAIATDYGVEYTTSEIIVTAGGKQALYNAAMVPVRRRRRSHHAHAGLADARRADQARRRDAGDRAHARRGRLPARAPTPFLAAITPRTRGIIINSPGNPTGALIAEDGARDGRRRSGAARHLDPARSLLREADLRPDAAQPAAACWPRGCATARCSAGRRRRRTR